MRRLPLLFCLAFAACAEHGASPIERPPPRKSARAVPPASAPLAPSAPIATSSAAPAAPSPAPQPYDLVADVATRRAVAGEELGKGTDTRVIERVFVVASPRGGALAGAEDVTRRALAAYFNGRFEKRPERAISVYLFPDAGRYHAFCKLRWQAKCDSPYGFYLSSERKIIMNVGPGLGTLTHELVHPLVEADFPNAPDWINEGIASLFEQFYLPKPGEIHGGKNWRHPRLMAALGSPKEKSYATLPALFAMDDAEFRGAREDLNYASARYLCQWLDERGLLWQFYSRFRDDYSQDPSGQRAFESVVGKTPTEANAEWTRWVRRL